MSEWRPPTENQIRKRAYEIYLERERECGGPLDDWLAAEAELFLRVREEVQRRRMNLSPESEGAGAGHSCTSELKLTRTSLKTSGKQSHKRRPK